MRINNAYIVEQLNNVTLMMTSKDHLEKEATTRMTKKRSEMEMAADILQVAKNGAKKSHIVYKANLNFKIMNEYLNHLITSGLITGPEGKNRIFRTTDKGIDYLNHFEDLKDYMKS